MIIVEDRIALTVCFFPNSTVRLLRQTFCAMKCKQMPLVLSPSITIVLPNGLIESRDKEIQL